MTFSQNSTQPRHWFNEQRNPAIDLGLFAIPAYVFPVLVTAVFIWTKPHRRFLQRLNRNPTELGPGVLQGVRNDRVGDFPRQLQGLLALFHVFCTGRALYQGTAFYRDDLMGYGLAEALSLLVGGVYLDSAMSPSYLATSAGWVLLAADQRTFAAAALLSLPCAWQLLGRTGLYHWQSGILLLVLALDYAELDVVHQTRAFITSSTKKWTLAIYFSCLLIGGILNLFRNTAQGGFPEILETILAELHKTCSEILRVLNFLLAFLVPPALNCAFTGFLGACIGWRWIFSEQPANPPFSSFLAAKLWLFLYLQLWCLIHVFQARRRHRGTETYPQTFLYEMIYSADVTGLTATIMVLMWWAILLLPHLKIVI